MKYYRIIIYSYLFLHLFGATKGIPEGDKVERLCPRGFRISMKSSDGGASFVRFHASVNVALNILDPHFKALITEPENGRWVYDNVNTRVKPGDIINYGIILYDSFGNLKGAPRQFINSAVLSDEPMDISNCGKSTTKCETSATTARGQSVCKGKLIFEENFDVLDSKIWSHEVRMPRDEFVSFQNRSENCYIKNDQLVINPTLLSDVPGFNELVINTGDLNLQDCTPIMDELRECRKKAMYAQILPPIISAKIHTKASFSFRYGKVKIRAKMPRGDWLFPLILLDPLENFYGLTDYASGQIKIAHVRGNDFLIHKKRDISSKCVSAGPILTNQNRLRDIKTISTCFHKPLSDIYHTYTLTWTEDRMTFEMDGQIYGSIEEGFSQMHKDYNLSHARLWNNGHIMAPFDREFYLTLGVSAGGHADFPDGCLNGIDELAKPWINHNPKAMFHFWKDRKNWLRTWLSDKSLQVDYIKVYAL